MKSAIPNVFIDTNVWFSALHRSPICYTIIQAHINDQITAVISQQVLEEIIRNIQIKIPHMLSKFQEIVAKNPPMLLPDPQKFPQYVRSFVHLYDQPIFTSAIIGKVDYFITGNSKHFQKEKLKKLTGIEILTPKEAMALLKL